MVKYQNLNACWFPNSVNDAASDAQSEYWRCVDNLTFAGDNQGHLQSQENIVIVPVIWSVATIMK